MRQPTRIAIAASIWFAACGGSETDPHRAPQPRAIPSEHAETRPSAETESHAATRLRANPPSHAETSPAETEATVAEGDANAGVEPPPEDGTVRGDGYTMRLLESSGDLGSRAESLMRSVRADIDDCGGTMWQGDRPLEYTVQWTSTQSAVSGPGFFAPPLLSDFATCARRAFTLHASRLHNPIAAVRTDVSGRARFELRIR